MTSPNQVASTPSASSNIVRGDEAIALGALAAGVRLVTGYPGSPATGVFDSLLRLSDSDQIHIQWAPNEKVAMEAAFGASLAGSRAMVVLKSVGMNIALDPLATMSLSGCHAGLVILLGDDPGGWASQNEQDSRWAARVAEVPIVEPMGVGSAAALVAQAFAWSESSGTPVIVRITRALALDSGPVAEPWGPPLSGKTFHRKRNRWIVLPAWVVRYHRNLHQRIGQMRRALEVSRFDSCEGDASEGVMAVGYTHTKLVTAIAEASPSLSVLALTSVWPLPEKRIIAWLRTVDRAVVLEEGGPFVEQAVRAVAQRERLGTTILGRADGAVPLEGELTLVDIDTALTCLMPSYRPPARAQVEREMPSTVPLCDDCPYRSPVDSLIQAMERHGGRRRHIVVGETGCMVRANLPPTELFDVKYSLGAGLGLGLGLAVSDRRYKVVALVGDSSFFHSDINAMPHLAFENPPMAVIVLDNGTTALTGGQAHPGSAADERGRRRGRHADVAQVIAGCGVEPIVVSADDRERMDAAIDEALEADELRVIVVRGPCPRYLQEA